MCGIAGVIDPEDRLGGGREVATRMAERLAHRGPDGHGVWTDPDFPATLAHRRLSVIDPSLAGRQPMSSSDNRHVLTYNGEIYDFEEVRSRLARTGHRFATATDTEVLLAALVEWGTDALLQIDGMFAFALWDSHRRELLLARDPFGEKPLYWTEQRGAFAFASELSALAAIPGFDPRIDPDAVALYLALQYIPDPRTIYASCHKLPPGCFLRWSPGHPPRVETYYRFHPGPVPRESSVDERADELEEVLVGSLRGRLIADVPVGTFLSGGIDSSLTAALLARRLGRRPKAYTIGFAGDPQSEHAAAAAIARHLGLGHACEVLSPDCLALAPKIGEWLDEPNADSSCLPTCLLSGLARREVTVCLSGDGGDELFGGYDRFRRPARRAAPGCIGYFTEDTLVFTLAELAEVLPAVPPALAEHIERLQLRIDAASGNQIHILREIDAGGYLPGAVLAKSDRMSMRHGLEVRTAFLSRKVADFATRLPADLIATADEGKILLRHLARRYLPTVLVDRPKQGFALPTWAWGHAGMVRAACELLADPYASVHQFLDGSAAARVIPHRGRNSFYKAWAILVFENWLLTHPWSG